MDWGGIANLSDGWGAIKGAFGKNAKNYDLATQKEPVVSHSAIVEENTNNNIISFGPSNNPSGNTNNWSNHLNDKGINGASRITINNVRKINQSYITTVTDKAYNLLTNNCVSQTSRALLKHGVLNIPILRHPHFLELQMILRNNSHRAYFIHQY